MSKSSLVWMRAATVLVGVDSEGIAYSATQLPGGGTGGGGLGGGPGGGGGQG